MLGDGTTGFVYAGINKSTNERVAIKVSSHIHISFQSLFNGLTIFYLPQTMTIATGDYEEVIKEIDLLVSLRSPYVVSFIEALQFDNQLWVSVFY